MNNYCDNKWENVLIVIKKFQLYLKQISSSILKTANDGSGENRRNISALEKVLESPVKIPLCYEANYLRDGNIAELNNIFNTDVKKV